MQYRCAAAFAGTTGARVMTYRMLAQKTKLFFSGPITNISTTCKSTLDANASLAALTACEDESRKTGLSQLLKLIDVDSGLDSFCSVILFVSLLRVIQVCRSCVACEGNAPFLIVPVSATCAHTYCLRWLLAVHSAAPPTGAAHRNHRQGT